MNFCTALASGTEKEMAVNGRMKAVSDMLPGKKAELGTQRKACCFYQGRMFTVQWTEKEAMYHEVLESREKREANGWKKITALNRRISKY